MKRISEWKLAQKLQASKKRGVIVGLSIAILIIVAVVIAVIKMRWIKSHLGCCDYDGADDFMDADGCDENGCCYTSEKDFV